MLVGVVLGVGVCTAFEQPRRDVGMAFAEGRKERRVEVHRRHIDVDVVLLE